jgi:uncharacterized membrane protein YjfL (UPF0719 family)
MNELFDKLILRFFLTVFVCGLLALYRYAHAILYPSVSQQLFRTFHPSKNSADTIHLFSRILGVAILFSEFHFYLSEGLGHALFLFSTQAILIFAFYLLALNIMESVILYNFEYADEIHKRKNYAYALICASQAVGVALTFKYILKTAQDSFILLFFLTLLVIVLLGFATKSFGLISKLPFNKLVVNKNNAIAFSYMGFILGWSVIIASSLNHPMESIDHYTITVILNIILSLLVFPLFRYGLAWVFRFKDDLQIKQIDMIREVQTVEPGYGIYEGGLFFTSCYLTTVITGQIVFGTFYPVF